MKKKGTMTFATFFPGCENTHLIKDVGMIPYVLHRDFGYESCLISYENGAYTHPENSVRGLKLLFLRRSFLHPVEDLFIKGDDRTGFPENWFLDKFKLCFTMLDLFRLLRRHGKDMDVFQVYHFRYESIMAGLLYRLFNRDGILYMKLDMNPVILEEYRRNPEQLKKTRRFSHMLFRKAAFDILSVESGELREFLKKEHALFRHYDLLYLPNGIDIKSMPVPSGFGQKEDVILHVARMGVHDKASENALEAFRRVAGDFPGWKLVLMGKMTDQFAELYQRFIERNPGIRDRIIYLGLVDDREAIYRYYDRAKVLLMPSRRESFGIAGIEAGYFGDVIVGSDIPALRTITDGGKLGYLCPPDDLGCLEKRLRQIMSGENGLNNMSTCISVRIEKHFDWTDICGSLDVLIREKRVPESTDMTKNCD